MPKPPELLHSFRDSQGNVTEYYRGHHPAEAVGASRVILTNQGYQGQETIVERGFMPKAVAQLEVTDSQTESVSQPVEEMPAFSHELLAELASD